MASASRFAGREKMEDAADADPSRGNCAVDIRKSEQHSSASRRRFECRRHFNAIDSNRFQI
jgi:hypothetical protein